MPTHEDYQWLTSTAGAEAIDRAAKLLAQVDLVVATTRLRKQYPLALSALALEQAALRKRAAAKFTDAGRMVFTDVGLQQASGEAVAAFKAARFPANAEVFDLCCGIGGDLFALARRGPTVGVERDPVIATLAAANCRALRLSHATVRTADVNDLSRRDMPLVHIDPDRRPQGQRTTQLSLHQPGNDYLESLLDHCDGGAIKLSPAANVPDHWQQRCQLQWISHAGECKQLIVWFGTLASNPTSRTAICLPNNFLANPTASTFDCDIAQFDTPYPPIATSLGDYIHEPDPAIIAAKLVNAFAQRHNLSAIAHGIDYLTGDQPIDHGCVTSFQVIDQSAMDLRRVKAMLKSHGVGRLEIKKRGVDIDPHHLQRRLRTDAPQSAVLILTPQAGKTIAILAKRTS